MKRILSLALTIFMLLSLAACKPSADGPSAEDLPASEPVTTQAPTSAPEAAPVTDKPTSPPADEYERAAYYGFVPDAANADAAVTEREISDMLAAMLEKHDESLTAEWNTLTKAAGDRSVKRDYGALFLLLAAERMGCAKFTNGFAPTVGEVDWDALWESMTGDYPLFADMCWDTCASISAERDWQWEMNYPTSAIQYALSRMSLKSGRCLMDLEDNVLFRCGDDMTVREAAVAVLRLYESVLHAADPAELAACTIPAELFEKAKTMPAVSIAQLPAWHGTTLSPDTLPWRENGRIRFEQSDIQQIADMGFNYVRLGCTFADLCAEENGTLYWKTDVLENIDATIGWCIELNIHVCLGMHTLPGYGSGYTLEECDIMTNPDHYRQAKEIWSVLSARYRDVPANALSYNLVNEPTFYVFGDEETYAGLANDLIASIRENDTEKLLVSDGMLADVWYNACPAMPCKALDHSVAQTIHLYPYHANARSNYLALQNWPVAHQDAVTGQIHDGAALTLTGTFPAGSGIVLYIGAVSTDHATDALMWKLDGRAAGSHVFTGLAEGVDGCNYLEETNGAVTARFGDSQQNGYTLVIPIEADAQSVTLTTDGNGASVLVTEMLIKRPVDTEQAYLVPQNGNWAGFAYETSKFEASYIALIDDFWDGDAEIILADDGSYTSPTPVDADWFDYESLSAYIKGWADWSKETGTPILCNEFGIPIGMPEGVRRAYITSVLELLAEYDIPWALYTNSYGIWGPVVYCSEGTNGMLPADGSYETDGNYAIDKPLLEVVAQFTR